MNRVQIKICGITKPEDAEFCDRLGVDAIGCVFFQKSSRFVTPDQAAEIRSAFRRTVVGVFVNPAIDDVVRIVERTGIQTVQLHGEEPDTVVKELIHNGIMVIKTFFHAKSPRFSEASSSSAPVFLAEPGIKGPGGTGSSWNWSEARELRNYGKPYLVAGGINPANVEEALRRSEADGVDLSSGVEKAPGIKDHDLIKALMETVRKVNVTWEIRPVFKGKS
jgi:phosphoribosylanthranilate isomerase